ncbi:13125_t:CDS:10, partial [Acaulospora morrowiae]
MVNNVDTIRPNKLSIREHQKDVTYDSPHRLYDHRQPMCHRERELGMRHHIFKILWNSSNFSSPIEKRLLAGGACVLVVGTNPSIMTFDLAAAYPHSTFIGLEIFPPHLSSPPLSPSSPSVEPPNATILQTHTLTSPQIPFPKECFDFVYYHSLMVPTVDPREIPREFEGWSREKEVKYELGLVNDMIRVLKPNGWIEFMKVEDMCDCELGNVTKKMTKSYLESMDASAVCTLNSKSLKSLLASTKKLHNITEESKDIVLGINGGRIGELLANTLFNQINSNGSSLAAYMKVSVQEFNEMYSAMIKEINECKARCHSYRKMTTEVTTSTVNEIEPVVEAESKSTTSNLKSFLAGGFGGISCVLVGHPFDLVKVRLQTAKDGQYKGMLDVTRQIIKADGIRGMYRGMGPPLVGITPIFSISFWSYNLGKKIVYWGTPNRKSQELTLTEYATAGLISAGPTTLIMAPVERIKVLLQIQGQGGEARYKGPIDVVRQLYKEGGFSSIFRGVGATLLRDGPGSAVYFWAYELTKKLLTPPDTDTLNPLAILFAGGMAGVAMWTIAIPPDVIKSRIQSAPAGTYRGFVDCLQKTVRTDGPKALFKGLGPALLRAYPANAAAFLGYETSLK